MTIKITFFDILVGIPAGLLTVMSTILFDAILLRLGIVNPLLSLPVLAFAALLVGMLAALARKAYGRGTALSAGITAALLLLGLRLFSSNETSAQSLLFGLPGALIALIVTPLGGHLVRRRA